MCKEKRKDPTHAELKELVHYDDLTGIFVWLVSPAKNVKAGDIAGSADSRGYIRIQINYKPHLANRLAWFYAYGVWPKGDVDHHNQNKSDNTLANLRECSKSNNSANRGKNKNNTSGLKGVSWNKLAGKYKVSIMHKGKAIHLGYFDSKIEAGRAYDCAAKKYHGEYADLNFPE